MLADLSRAGRAGMLAQVHGSHRLESAAAPFSGTVLVVRPVHLHRHTRAARARRGRSLLQCLFVTSVCLLLDDVRIMCADYELLLFLLRADHVLDICVCAGPTCVP